MARYVCSNCGAGAYFDGRCGDGPVLTCKCAKGRWVNDGRGGYQSNPRNAHAVEAESYDDPGDDAWASSDSRL